MTDETALKLTKHLQAANEALGLAVRLARDECAADEFEVWRGRIAKVMGSLVMDALDPLYRERPALAPEALRHVYPSK